MAYFVSDGKALLTRSRGSVAGDFENREVSAADISDDEKVAKARLKELCKSGHLFEADVDPAVQAREDAEAQQEEAGITKSETAVKNSKNKPGRGARRERAGAEKAEAEAAAKADPLAGPAKAD